MKDELVSFEVAKLAKELGFKEKTFHYYYYYENDKNNKRLWPKKIGTADLHAASVSGMSSKTASDAGFLGCDTSDYLHYRVDLEDMLRDIKKYPARKVMFQAPTQSLLQKWLREVHGIHIVISPYFCHITKDLVNYEIEIFGKYGRNETNSHSINEFPTYEEALEKGLLQALKLIKK